MRARLLAGFSLMEMMVVLLIVAIIAAASAPMVSKKMSRGSSGESPWVFTGLGNNIAYNMSGDANSSAIIGSSRYTRRDGNSPTNPRLVIASGNDTNHPALAFADSTGTFSGQINVSAATGIVTMNDQSLGNNSVAIGRITNENGSIDTVGIGNGIDVWAGKYNLIWIENFDQARAFLNGINIYSDRRLKNIGKKYTSGLAELKKLDFFHYTFKKDELKTPRVGVMAQDLQKVFPNAVTKGDDGYLRIRLEDMFYAVINAVKELDTTVTKIIEKLEAQEEVIVLQQKEIEALKKQNEEMLKRNAEILKVLKKLRSHDYPPHRIPSLMREGMRKVCRTTPSPIGEGCDGEQ